MGFVNLHVHSCYSFLDGAQTPEQIILRAKELGQESIALTDHGNMHGMQAFNRAAKEHGIRPIFGMEAYIAPGDRTIKEKPADEDERTFYHLLLLAKNDTGLKNLFQLSTLAYTEGFYYRPRLDYDLLEKYNEGIICTSACLSGRVNVLIGLGQEDAAEKEAIKLRQIFGKGNFYLEVQRGGMQEQEDIIPAISRISKSTGIPIVATTDAHFSRPEDKEFQLQIVGLGTNRTVDEVSERYDELSIHIRSYKEMTELFPDMPEAVSNSEIIANQCQVILPEHYDYIFPVYSIDDSSELIEEAWLGLRDKKLSGRKEYEERLDYELKTIEEMGFASYFMVVADYIRWARQQGIAVGPGRGSAAGSLVAYVLGITGVDPLKYDLLFQRFLNKGRKSMPDIDVDFCKLRRGEIIEYLQQRYGEDKVAQITTFGEFKPRGAMRDFARVQGKSYALGDAASKLVPKAIRGEEPDWERVRNEAPELWRGEFKEITEMAERSDGLVKQSGIHAAAVVISKDPIIDHLPLYLGKDKQTLTQWDMNDVESIGLVKMDLLGLKSLTIINTCVGFIKETAGEEIDIDSLPLDDKTAFDLISAGDTNGLFQLDAGGGIRDLCTRLKPKDILEVSAISALYRPGPLDSGTTFEYVRRAQGRSAVEYLVPELKPILQETYGLLIYQEQTMKIATDLAGYSLEEADDLRKAIGKKRKDLMAKEKNKLIAGLKKTGISNKKAKTIWAEIKKFAAYGFNKSHAVAYSFITYYTAYLKAHYPLEYYCALLSSHMDERDKIMDYLADCRSKDIQVQPPDVNESEVGFAVKNGVIRFGLAAITGIGEKVAARIVEARKDGPFTGLVNFYNRTRTKGANKKTIEALAKTGAFDTFECARAGILNVADELATHHKKMEAYNKKMVTFRKKTDRFEQREEDRREAKKSGTRMPAPLKVPVEPEPPRDIVVPECDELDMDELLALEKEMLGLYVTSHPLYSYSNELLTRTTAHTASLVDHMHGESITLLGLISSARHITTKRGTKMAALDIEDLNGHVKVAVFGGVYKKANKILEEGSVVLLTAKVEEIDDKNRKLVASEIELLPKKRVAPKEKKIVGADINAIDTPNLTPSAIKDIMGEYPGDLDLRVTLTTQDGTFELFKSRMVSALGLQKLKKIEGLEVTERRE